MEKKLIEPFDTPKVVLRKLRSIQLCWNDVFPDNTPLLSYALDIHEERHGLPKWRRVYWGIDTGYTIHQLAPCTRYSFRLKAHNSNLESDWIHFETYTETEVYYPQHLTYAINHKKVTTIRKIVAWSSDLLEQEDIYSCTPLMLACQNGDLDVVKLLVGIGAKVNNSSKTLQRTPLMVALMHNFSDIAEYLLQRRADAEMRDKLGNTALHLAAINDALEAIDFALKVGFEVNCQNFRGWTPLILAGIFSSEDTIKLLLQYGADPAIKDKDGNDFLKHIKLHDRMHLAKLVSNNNNVNSWSPNFSLELLFGDGAKAMSQRLKDPKYLDVKDELCD